MNLSIYQPKASWRTVAFALSIISAFSLLKLLWIQLSALSWSIQIILVSLIGFALLPTNHIVGATTTKAYRILVRGLSTLFFFYILVGPWFIPSHSAELDIQLIAMNISTMFWCLFSFRYPSTVLPASLSLLMQKSYISSALGIAISSTDYMPLIEIGMLLGLSSGVVRPGLIGG